jgi:hypothetical protein
MVYKTNENTDLYFQRISIFSEYSGECKMLLLLRVQ